MSYDLDGQVYGGRTLVRVNDDGDSMSNCHSEEPGFLKEAGPCCWVRVQKFDASGLLIYPTDMAHDMPGETSCNAICKLAQG
jgi:hypothetical protein